MQHIGTYLPRNGLERQTKSVSSEKVMPGIDRSHIGELWARMAEIYGHAWVSQYGETDSHDTWLIGLRGISEKQLAEGIQRCLDAGGDWPPSLPRFRRYCLSIPAHREAKQRLEDGSPFSLLVWQYLDKWSYERASYDQAERLFADAYLRAVEHVDKGLPMPEKPVAAITHQEPLRDPDAPRMSRAEAISKAKQILRTPR